MGEIVRLSASFAAGAWWLGVCVFILACGLLVFEARGVPRLSPHLARWSHRIFLAAAVGVGLALAWQVLWLCDDAYISFRYARNFAEGHGLVFNEGEWVEGYTNFLWTWLLGWIGRLGGDIPLAGLAGNLLAFVMALLAVAAVVRRASPGQALIPFAALVLAASRPFHTFASSGLETMPAAALIALAMLATTWKRGAWLAGLALTCATLMRPDQALIWGCMGLALVVEDLVARKELPLLRRLDFRRYLAYGAPFVLLYVPYFLWRWNAYGDLFPNTYYAKSGGGAYYEQGLVYLVHFLATTGAWLWLPLLVATAFLPGSGRDETRLRTFALLAVAIFGHYVVKVGGDFMEHRFFVPLLPIAFVALEVSLRSQLARTHGFGRWAWAGAAVAALVFAALPVRPLGPWQKKWHLADESSFYRLGSVFPIDVLSGSQTHGKELGRVFTARGLEPRVAEGAIGLLGYHSRLPIVDVLGLVTRSIAHKEVSRRGRPGHEKFGDVHDLLAEGAVISMGDHWGPRWKRFTSVRADGLDFYLLQWDDELMQALGDTPNHKLPNLQREIAALLDDGARADLVDASAFLELFLAEHPRRAALLAPLRDRLRSVAEFEGALPDGARVEGEGIRLASGAAPGGASGRGWLASLPDRGGGRGKVEIALGALPAAELRFAFGGTGSASVAAELVVDGAVVRRATPAGSAVLLPQSWDVTAFAGKPALLRFVDEDAAPGKGLLADGIHFSHPTDDIRQRLRAGTGRALPLLAAAEEVLPADDPDLGLLAARFEHRWDLDRLPEGSRIEGEAFGDGPVPGALPGQSPVRGAQGVGLLNSFHGGDGSVGRVELPAFELTGTAIHLRVGGGKDCDTVYVGLEVEGEVRRRFCGKNDETLRDVIIPTARYRGKQGRLVVVDEGRGGWGHILVDAIAVERPRPEAQPASHER